MENPLRRAVAVLCSVAVLSVGILFAGDVGASEVRLSNGQTVYVPVYSHIYSGNQERPILLAVTLSVRNTDLKNWITIEAVDYYDSDGNLVKKYLELPVQLRNMASIRYIIPESDKSGGSGANFIVRWNSAKTVNAPVIESVMISTRMSQGISFTSRGVVLTEAKK